MSDRIDVTPRRSRHARLQLQEIHRVALGGQQGTRRAAQFAHRRVGRHPVAFAVTPLHVDTRIDATHHFVEPWHAAQHGFFTHDDPRVTQVGSRNQPTGLVAGTDVFRQRVGHVALDRRVKRAAILRADFREER